LSDFQRDSSVAFYPLDDSETGSFQWPVALPHTLALIGLKAIPLGQRRWWPIMLADAHLRTSMDPDCLHQTIPSRMNFKSLTAPLRFGARLGNCM